VPPDNPNQHPADLFVAIGNLNFVSLEMIKEGSRGCPKNKNASPYNRKKEYSSLTFLAKLW
jgi:hypothetical protein